MSLLQLLNNLAPTAADVRGPAAPSPGRRGVPAGADFGQTLQQSRQRLDREAPAETPQPVVRQTSRQDARGGRQDARAAAEPSKPVKAGDREPSASTSADDAKHVTADDASPRLGEPSLANDQPADAQAAEHTAPTADEAGSSAGAENADDADTAADGEATWTQLLSSLRQWMQQGQGDEGDDVTADALLEDVEALAAALMQGASGEGMQTLVKAGSAGDELARMVQQLAMGDGGSPRMADPLAALMAVTPMSVKGMTSGRGATAGPELAGVLPAGEGEAADGKGLRFGATLAQALPALASMLQSGGQASDQGGELQTLLAQLATAAGTGQGGQNTAGSELLTALMQGGAQAGQGNGQGIAGAAALGGPGQAHGGEGDAPAANAARLARAMQGAVKQGGGAMTLRMTPSDLGTVRIQLQVQAGTVNAALHAETEGARTLLSQQLSQLRQSLENQGLHVERLSVQSMNNHGSANLAQQGQSDGTPDDGRSRDEYRQSGQRQGGQREGNDDGEARASASAGFEQALDDVAGG